MIQERTKMLVRRYGRSCDWEPLYAALIVPRVSMLVSGPAAAADTAPPVEAAVPATKTRETLFPKLRLGDDDGYLEFYGQINKGVLVFDDGGSTLGYIPVDNGNSSAPARMHTTRRTRNSTAVSQCSQGRE
jgi:hypothetical protein